MWWKDEPRDASGGVRLSISSRDIFSFCAVSKYFRGEHVYHAHMDALHEENIAQRLPYLVEVPAFRELAGPPRAQK